MSRIDDTFNILSGMVIYSNYGGYYLFSTDFEIKPTSVGKKEVWGKITMHGAIRSILENKCVCMHGGHSITEWLDGWKQERAFWTHAQMCDIYARHILHTWPEPGLYWEWK